MIHVNATEIKELMSEIYDVFRLVDFFDEDTLIVEKEALETAFRDNVMYQDRNSDMGVIIYSLLDYIQRNGTDDFDFVDMLAVHIMPTGWSYQWLNDCFVNSIDPYLEDYTIPESQLLLKVLKYLRGIGFLRHLESQMLDDIEGYWTKMAYHRADLIPTKDIVERERPAGVHWNDFLKCIMPDNKDEQLAEIRDMVEKSERYFASKEDFNAALNALSDFAKIPEPKGSAK